MSSRSSFYAKKRVFITGGAGFIGSAITDRLIQRGAVTTIGDNLSSGSLKNILRIWRNNGLSYKKNTHGYSAEGGHKFIRINFENYEHTRKALNNHEIVFHLAANFGGRGYIDTHPADCCECFSLNQNVIKAAHQNGVERILFASSACVYPHDLQKNYGSEYLLKEADAMKNEWANADKEYGWSKLMGELTLQAYNKQYGLKGVCTRYVTAYGPWENDTHAIIALIRRAVQKQDPYIVWGSGKQDRDFTYVDDIANGSLLACEKISNAEAVNLGTSTRYTIRETIEMIFEILGWRPKKIIFDRAKPEGVKTRALKIAKAQKILGYKPEYNLRKGLEKTIEWYLKEKPRTSETII